MRTFSWITCVVVAVFLGPARADDPSVDPFLEGKPVSQWLTDLQSEDKAIHDAAAGVFDRAGRQIIPILCKVVRHSEPGRARLGHRIDWRCEQGSKGSTGYDPGANQGPR